MFFQFLRFLGHINRALIIFVFLTTFVMQGFCGEADSSTNFKQDNSIFKKAEPTIEAKAGYFFFTNSKMRKIYDQGGIDVQISGAYPIWKGLQIYGSVEYLRKSGRSLNDHQKTSIWQIPVNIGLRPVITICPEVQYYVTVGPRYFYIHQHNQSSYVPKNKGRSGIGMFVNTGFNFLPWHGLLVDVFGEYSYAQTSFHNSKDNVHGRSIQVGGFAFGVGVGYCF